MLYGPFKARLDLLFAACQRRGAFYVVTCGFRSYEDQAVRYRRYIDKTGTKAAPAGKSQHQFGLAVDCVLDTDPIKPGLQADYASHAYNVLAEEIPKFGLITGRHFGDDPHVGAPRFVSGLDLGPLRSRYILAAGTEAEKVAAVWNWLEGLPLFPKDTP